MPQFLPRNQGTAQSNTFTTPFTEALQSLLNGMQYILNMPDERWNVGACQLAIADWSRRIEDLLCEQSASVPALGRKPDGTFKSPAILLEQIIQELIAHGDGFDGGTAAGATFHMMASRLREFAQQPAQVGKTASGDDIENCAVNIMEKVACFRRDHHWEEIAKIIQPIIASLVHARMADLQAKLERAEKAYWDLEHELHDILAEGLGYHKEAENDPTSPCPGMYVTGEHVAASLAMEAKRKLADLQAENLSFQQEIASLKEKLQNKTAG